MSFKKTPQIPMGIIDIRRSVISAVFSFIVTVILFLLLSLFALISIIPEGAIRVFSLIVTVFASFVAGFLTSKNVSSYGLFNGLFSGLIYFVIIFIISVILSLKFPFNKELLFSFLFIMAGSAIGGLTGINIRATRRSRRKYKRYR